VGEAKAAAWWPWALGGAALVAGAVVGGYVLLRPEAKPGAAVPGTAATIDVP
jgi:hypothetical protein